jgi:nucleotide-binding universal stress UspA family protein
VAARVSTAAGDTVEVPDGGRLVFGRGPDADLVVVAGRGLSRRAGLISGLDGGVLVSNLSRTHALYAVGEDYRIRLPRLETGGEPTGGWFVRTGSVEVGSQAMLDDGSPLRIDVAGGSAEPVRGGDRGDATLLPLRLDPDTKIFLVALMWCRPWLVDPSRTTPLPRTPEIARAALEVTDAHYELERFDSDPAFRDRLAARVGEHLKSLRQKIAERGLVRPGVRLSDEVVAEVLLEYAVITPADLARLDDPAWCTRQEDLWWTRER